MLVVPVAGHPIGVNLDRVYGVCTNDPPSCEQNLAELTRAIQDATRVAPMDAGMLRVAVRTHEYVTYVTGAQGALLAPAQPIAGDLEAIVMVDEPSRARPASAGDLVSLGLDRDAAHARAWQNTLAASGSVAKLAQPTGEGSLRSLDSGGYYESSLLLDTAGWAEVAKRQPGTLFVSVPAADTLLYKWVTTEKDAQAFRLITGEVAKKSHTPLSATVLKWNGSGWEVAP